MKDSWCKRIHYRGKQLSGGAARNVLISRSGGMDAIINKVATQVYNAAVFAANTADGRPPVSKGKGILHPAGKSGRRAGGGFTGAAGYRAQRSRGRVFRACVPGRLRILCCLRLWQRTHCRMRQRTGVQRFFRVFAYAYTGLVKLAHVGKPYCGMPQHLPATNL